MRSLQRSSIATSALLALAVVAPAKAGAQSPVTPAKAGAQSPVAPAKAGAQFSSAGTITHLSGPLLAQKADGRTRVIAQGAAIDVGDTVVTGNGAYAEIHFADDSDAILQPDTTLTVDAFAHDASRPESERARWTIGHGGMQVTSGAIASSGRGHHTIATPLGTIEVAPSRFVMTVAAPASTPVALSRRVYLAANTTGTMSDVPAPLIVAQSFDLANPGNLKPPPPVGGTLPPSGPSGLKPPSGLPPGSVGPAGLGGTVGAPILPPGLHLQVTDGAIVVTNNGGSQGFQAGQFGFVPNVNQPPVIVPPNTGIQFVPPPSFGSGSGGPTASPGTGSGQAVDCIVR